MDQKTYAEQRFKMTIARLKNELAIALKDSNDFRLKTKRVITLFLNCRTPNGDGTWVKCAPNDSDFTEAEKLIAKIV
ncbi:hypothetical protein LCGC14_1815060 [marine sediment metagenome]|uniref:Uncharacterized protein n=1 Tax=marine sediment metagenome TaxID=412755 RepID=A0A0F9GKH1_9ZZZZ